MLYCAPALVLPADLTVRQARVELASAPDDLQVVLVRALRGRSAYSLVSARALTRWLRAAPADVPLEAAAGLSERQESPSGQLSAHTSRIGSVALEGRRVVGVLSWQQTQ